MEGVGKGLCSAVDLQWLMMMILYVGVCMCAFLSVLVQYTHTCTIYTHMENEANATVSKCCFFIEFYNLIFWFLSIAIQIYTSGSDA